MRLIGKILNLLFGLVGFFAFGALTPILMLLVMLSIPEAVLYGWAFKNPPIKRMMKRLANTMGIRHRL